MSIFFHVKDYLKQNRLKYFIGIFLLIAVDFLQLLTPLITGSFVDTVRSGISKEQVIFYSVSAVLIALGVALGRYGWRSIIIGIAKTLEYKLRKKVFAKLSKLNRTYYNNNKTGDLMARCTNDISTIRQAFGQGTILVVDSFFMTIMAIYIMITRVNISLTLVALIPLPIVAVVILLLTKSVGNKFKKVQEAFSTISEKAQESFSGVRVIKSFVQENESLLDFNIANKNNMKEALGLVKVQGVMHPFVSSVSFTSLLISIFYGGNLVMNQVISLGDLVSFIALIGMMTWPMMALGFMFTLMQRGKVSLIRINEILNAEDEVLEVPQGHKLEGSAISVRNLSFSYPGTMVKALDNISFNVNAGETLAIVGHTGAGKTTIVELILKVYDVDNQSIFIGGEDINSLNLESLRSQIGYVPQSNFLFSKSINQNVGFNTKVVDNDRVKDMTKISMVYKEIDSLTNSFETELGERGVNLSGGQKQRISIARAFYKSPDIIILDDSLSAVDTKTEGKILRHINEELADKTTVVISHRISTVKSADKIIVLEEGRIIEEGTHDSLIELGGYYNNLYNMQLLEEKILEE